MNAIVIIGIDKYGVRKSQSDKLNCHYFGYAQYRIPAETCVAPSRDVGQFDTDACGMTEFLTRKEEADLAVR